MTKSNKQAFTLIELLVVVLIIGILAAVAVPQYRKAVVKSHYAKLKVLAKAIADAEEVHYLADNSYVSDVEKLDIELPAPISTSATGASGDAGIKYVYDWGECSVFGEKSKWGERVSCQHNLAQMGYEIYFSHSIAAPDRRMCVALNTDLSSAQNKLCASETGKATGINQGSYYDWRY